MADGVILDGSYGEGGGQIVRTALALSALRGYQATLSPWIERTGTRCRFTMSCSRYAAVVIERDGLVRGTWLAARRIVRCGPWTPEGTVDNP